MNHGHSHLVAFGGNRTSGPIDVSPALNACGSASGRLDFESEAFIAFSCKDYGADAGSLSPTLRAMGHSGSHANAGGQVAVCVTGEVTQTLKAEGFDGSEDGTGRGQPIVAYAISENQRAEVRLTDYAQAVTCSGGKPGQGYPAALHGSAVRRLTPTECERLQGFPGGYTQVPYRGKPMADGPRYKMLGNSMAVPCMAWIGRRIDAALRSAHNAR